MNNHQIAIAEALMDLEKELRCLGLWSSEPPSAEALASQQPFAIDTLSFPQWLQFIFLPRMYYLLENGHQLPGNCGIAPMAEQYFSTLSLHASPLVTHLSKIDDLLTHLT